MTDILQLPGWEARHVHVQDGQYIIEADYTRQDETCQKCGVIGRLYRHGTKKVSYRDSPTHGKPVVLEGTIQRYKCRDCGETFVQSPAGIEADRRMTARCVEYIKEQCLRDTFTRMAEHIGCVEGTIRNIAGDQIKLLDADYKPYLPTWLGMDETTLDGSLRCILTDVGARKPIDILRDRDLPTVTHWLYQFRDRRVVKGLAIDMWRPFKTAAHTVFPGLPVVIDKFHLVRMANMALDNLRVSLAKEYPRVVGRDWMRRKALLRMRYKNLDEKGRFNLQMWLDNEPDVGIAYRLKEAFYDIYDAPTKEAAGKLLDDWRASVPARMRKGKKDYKPLMTSTGNWRDEMLAYFDHPISNGYTEALNGVAKVINRAGRGYNFDVIRARVLFRNRKPAYQVEEPVAMYRVQNPGREALMEALGYRCESCHGVFEDTGLVAAHVAPMTRGERPRRLYICPDCHARFHTGLTHDGSQVST